MRADGNTRAPGGDFVLCTIIASALDCDKGRALDPRKMEYFVRSKNIPFFRYEKSPQGARYETQMESN